MKLTARASELRLRVSTASIALRVRVGSFIGRFVRRLLSASKIVDRVRVSAQKRRVSEGTISDVSRSVVYKERVSRGKLTTAHQVASARTYRSGLGIATVLFSSLSQVRLSAASLGTQIRHSVGKARVSPVALSSTHKADVSKPLSTPLKISNPIFYLVGRVHESTMAATDRLLGFVLGKGVSDSVSTTDVQSSQFGKRILAIGLMAEDLFNVVFIAKREFSSPARFDDLLKRDLSVKTPTQDAFKAGNEGTLSIHDYSEITYFLEDYVGKARYL